MNITTTFEDAAIFARSQFPFASTAATIANDRRAFVTMKTAQRTGAAYVQGNRDGYTALIRVRQNDQG